MSKIYLLVAIFLVFFISCSDSNDQDSNDQDCMVPEEIFGEYYGLEIGKYTDVSGGVDSIGEEKNIVVVPITCDSILIDEMSAFVDSSLRWSATYEGQYRFYNYKFRNDSLLISYYIGGLGGGWWFDFEGAKI